MPNEWSSIIVVFTLKINVIQDFTNYKGIKFMSHTNYGHLNIYEICIRRTQRTLLFCLITYFGDRLRSIEKKQYIHRVTREVQWQMLIKIIFYQIYQYYQCNTSSR